MEKKNLQMLINDFSRVRDEKPSHDFCYDTYHEIGEYYHKIYQEMKTGYAIKDIEEFARNPKTYEKLKDSSKLGLFISAAINKNIKKGEKIFINPQIPINLLFYNLNGLEAHVNKAGDKLGYCMKNSKIYANEAGDYAGSDMLNSELHIDNAGDSLAEYARNSTIYANRAKDDAGLYMENSELHITIADNYLGSGAENSKIYVGKAGAWAGYYMKNSELKVANALDYLGYGARNSKIYAEKMRIQYDKNSYNQANGLKLYIGVLEGKLKNRLNLLIDLTEKGNEVYLSRKTYYKHRILYKTAGANIWNR